MLQMDKSIGGVLVFLAMEVEWLCVRALSQIKKIKQKTNRNINRAVEGMLSETSRRDLKNGISSHFVHVGSTDHQIQNSHACKMVASCRS